MPFGSSVMANYERIGNPPAKAPIAAPEQLETQLFPVLKVIYAIELMLTPAYTLSKLSVLCLYLSTLLSPSCLPVLELISASSQESLKSAGCASAPSA